MLRLPSGEEVEVVWIRDPQGRLVPRRREELEGSQSPPGEPGRKG